MSVSKTKTKAEETQSPNQCPKCQFKGNKQFPKGFAVEKYPKIVVKTIKGEEVQELAKQKGKIVFNEVRRCPKCGFKEREDLHG